MMPIGKVGLTYKNKTLPHVHFLPFKIIKKIDKMLEKIAFSFYRCDIILKHFQKIGL